MTCPIYIITMSIQNFQIESIKQRCRTIRWQTTSTDYVWGIIVPPLLAIKLQSKKSENIQINTIRDGQIQWIHDSRLLGYIYSSNYNKRVGANSDSTTNTSKNSSTAASTSTVKIIVATPGTLTAVAQQQQIKWEQHQQQKQ